MTLLSPSILVTSESLQSDDSYALVESNIDSVNELIGRLLEYEEISPEALKSYYVDYYLAQVKNGGFAQFIYNIGCDGEIIEFVQQGLVDMRAERHAALLDRSLAIIEDMSEEALDRFLDSEFFGDNAERDLLNAHNSDFYALDEEESLVEANSRWLRQHPQLQVVDEEDLEDVLDGIADKIHDIEAREQAAQENEPRYVKVIAALCEATGQELERITAGDPAHEYQGQPVLAWHFLTDQGHFYMIDLGDRAIMFAGDSENQVTEVDVSHLLPDEDDDE